MSAIVTGLLLAEAILKLAAVASSAQAILSKARAEGREVTDEELKTLSDETDATFKELQELK